MRAIKLIKTYASGSRLDRMAIQSKVMSKICKCENSNKLKKAGFKHLINITDLIPVDTIPKDVFEHYLKHEFNFLGLGWTEWNIESANSVDGYKRIAWNRDIRSGYEFSKGKPNSTFIEHIPKGTDIKIPWELARMQYWPQLALYSLQNAETRGQVQKEFQSQMKDFIESNPVGTGIHFFCAMEVAIRAINLMISYDIISQYSDCLFSNDFNALFEEYLYSHLNVIVNRLEKNYFTGHTGNHYLTDLCGLLWMDMYFDSNLTRKIRADVIEELIKESKKQFTESGSSFECSTGYHLLASEILALSFFAINTLKPKAIQEDNWEMLSRGRQIIDVFEARDHRIVQIGDNDSGRILKLKPLFMEDKEDCLNPIEIKNLLDYLLGLDSDSQYAKLMESYNRQFKPMTGRVATTDKNESHKEFFCFNEIKEKIISTKTYRVDVKLGEHIRTEYISDFGIIKIQCINADVYIRTIPKYEKMDTSHSHDDVFSYQVITDNGRINEDLGSIVYTSDKEKRNFYASAQSHSVPRHSVAMMKRTDTFVTKVNAIGRVIINDKKIILEARWDGIIHIRQFELSSNGMEISDYSNECFELQEMQNNCYSLGYGQLYKR